MRGKKAFCIVALAVGVYVFYEYDKNRNYNAYEEALKTENTVKAETHKSEENQKSDPIINKNTVQEEQSKKVNFKELFEKSSISEKVKQRIYGSSWKKGAPIGINDLSYLTVTYYGFDDKPHLGELIVNKSVASEVLDIFKELYKEKYPINKMKLIDDYEAIDEKSMEDDNSSAFCYREVTDSTKISKHGYGLAIDINPLENPYVKGNIILPDSSKEFLDREKVRKGIIIKEDACYKAFTKRGWSWGGNWASLKDYQHFEK
jgi:hypothetical protein